MSDHNLISFSSIIQKQQTQHFNRLVRYISFFTIIAMEMYF